MRAQTGVRACLSAQNSNSELKNQLGDDHHRHEDQSDAPPDDQGVLRFLLLVHYGLLRHDSSGREAPLPIAAADWPAMLDQRTFPQHAERSACA